MQHVNLKLFAKEPYPETITAVIPVFHRWIQQSSLPGLLIDVANYTHVPNGPGVLLIGHEFDISLDQADGELGLLYNRKQPTHESGVESLRSAYRVASEACRLLEAAPELSGALRFKEDRVRVTLNDRLLYPNSEKTADALHDDFLKFFQEIFPGAHVTVERNPDPRARFSLVAQR